MDYFERALEFYERSLNENDAFTKFLFKYISFEIFYKVIYKKITKVANDEYLKKDFFDKINVIKIEELKHELDITPHKNVGNPWDKSWTGKLTNLKDFSGLVQFLRRARNNLFHGDKGISDERDIFIVSYGNIILNSLLETLLNLN